MVKFVKDKTSNLKLYCTAETVIVNVHFKISYVAPFTVLYNAIVYRTALSFCSEIQSHKIINSMIQVTFNQ